MPEDELIRPRDAKPSPVQAQAKPSPAQRQAPPSPATKRLRITEHPLVTSVDGADLDKPLTDPAELERIPHGELDAIGMVYEGANLADVILNNGIFGCRRILNHFFPGAKGDSFNDSFDKVKHVIRGTGVFTKAMHGYGPLRRKVNMHVTGYVARKYGEVTKETMTEYHKIFNQWKKEFAKPLFATIPLQKLSDYLRDTGFIMEAAKDSSIWLLNIFGVQGQEEGAIRLSLKFLRHYAKEVGVEKTKWYEALEPKIVTRPPPTPHDTERERIAEDTALMGVYDTDLLIRPSKKKKKRRRR